MSLEYFDTSTLVKFYHSEFGSISIETFSRIGDSARIISRLAAVEFQSAIAKKVRIGQISADDAEEILKQFEFDVKMERWHVVKLLVGDYKHAAKMIRKHAFKRNLRALDSLQLAAALRIKSESSVPFRFVSNDDSLVETATMEGLEVFSPGVT